MSSLYAIPRSDAELVRRGARLGGAIADARFKVNVTEHCRRVANGLASEVEVARLADALQDDGSDLRPPGVVAEVMVVASRAVHSVFARAAGFVRVAPTTVVIPWPTEPSLEQFRLEADALGLGLVIKVGGTRERLLWPPQRELPFDAGVWRFVERAYGLWLDQRGLGTGER